MSLEVGDQVSVSFEFSDYTDNHTLKTFSAEGTVRNVIGDKLVLVNIENKGQIGIGITTAEDLHGNHVVVATSDEVTKIGE